MSDPFDNTSYGYEDFGFYWLTHGGFVVSGSGELDCTQDGLGAVRVSAGQAVCYTEYYTNDASVSIPITAAANNRIDRIVLRYSAGNRQVRLTKIIGTAAANPSPPAFTTGDVPLWWIWVPAGFNPAVNAISTASIHDERRFLNSSYMASFGRNINLMPNSEFIAFSAATLGNDAPEFWRVTAAPPTSITAATRPTNQARGNAVRMQGNVAEGMTVTVGIGPGMPVTLKGTINITAGAARVTVGAVSKIYYRTGVDQEFVLRFVGNGDTDITVECYALNTDFKVSQLLLVEGYVPGGLRPKHEVIMLDYAIADANWTNTAKSTGTTLIDLGVDFGGLVPLYIRGLIVKLRARDSGSAAGVAGLALYHPNNTTTPVSRLYLDGVVNDKYRETIGYVPCDFATASQHFRIGVTATGAGTLDATVEIIGIVT